jgi:hypothetical protein
MMLKKLKIFAAATAISVTSVLASAATLDFTDSSQFSGRQASPLAITLDGVDGEVTASRRMLNFSQGQDGSTCPGEILACENDGAGVGDDEISGLRVTESIGVTFESAMSFQGFYLLDLFTGLSGNSAEEAQYSLDGGLTYTSVFADPNETPNGDSGYLFVDLGGAMSDSILFRAPRTNPQDGLGVNDFALAAISAVAAVPLPAGGLMLLSALGGFVILRRRQKAAAAGTNGMGAQSA